jgi:energy-coupling factor transporter ATP-binding protein EcfA2
MAIAGANGAGKSTLLALAACAFHNKKDGYCVAGRRNNYYTFSDFFIQSSGEIGPNGVEINYKIFNEKLDRSKEKGQVQVRRKPKGGKWNNYEARSARNVIYFGVQRVVPFFERATHRSYKMNFKSARDTNADSTKIVALANKILAKNYSDFEILRHNRYTLPRVTSQTYVYSGFNMGAGESGILEILMTIFEAGEGCLLIIDEIELGLHEGAQKRFISVLKELCSERKCQIICTTHSFEVLASLPPEGRAFIESLNGETHVYPGISAEYACGKLGGSDTHELDIFVEDEVAEAFVIASLNQELRARCRIVEIGSHGSITRVMASRYLEGRKKCLAILDGDQSAKVNSITTCVTKMCDSQHSQNPQPIKDWISARLLFLPGENWPEKWMFEKAIELFDKGSGDCFEELIVHWGLPNRNILRNYLEIGLASGKHNEFPNMAELVHLSETRVREDLVRLLVSHASEPFENISTAVHHLLENF